MQRKELIYVTMKRSGLSESESAAAVEAACDVITQELTYGGHVQLTNFGIFDVKKRPARMAYSRTKKDQIYVPESVVPVFFAANKPKRVENCPDENRNSDMCYGIQQGAAILRTMTLLGESASRRKLPNDYDMGFEEVLKLIAESNEVNRFRAQIIDLYYRQNLPVVDIERKYGVTERERIREIIQTIAKTLLSIPYLKGFLIRGYSLQKELYAQTERRWKEIGWKLPGEKDEVPIEWLGMPNRTAYALRRNGIATVGQLTKFSSRELAEMKGIGKNRKYEIEAALQKVSCSLRENVS